MVVQLIFNLFFTTIFNDTCIQPVQIINHNNNKKRHVIKTRLLYLSHNKNNKLNNNDIWIGNERAYNRIDLIMKILHNSTEEYTGTFCNKMTTLATLINDNSKQKQQD